MYETTTHDGRDSFDFTDSTKTSGEVVDLLAALQRSITAAKQNYPPFTHGDAAECHAEPPTCECEVK